MKQEAIYIAINSGDAAIVPGIVVTSAFAVHHPLPLPFRDSAGLGAGWKVTHLPTGLSVGVDMTRQKDAIALATALSEIKGSGKGRFGKPEYLTKKVLEPMKKIRGDFIAGKRP